MQLQHTQCVTGVIGAVKIQDYQIPQERVIAST